ncbi:MAG: hypothetical protein ABFS32_16610 [Bacteroidota bacterium]
MYRNFFLVLLVIIPMACEDNDIEPIYREDLVGLWVNVDNEIDTLEIWFCILRRYALEPNEFYYSHTYKIEGDSITLNYRPVGHIDVGNIACKVQFLDEDYQYLSIDDLSQTAPFYPGTEFRRVDPE